MFVRLEVKNRFQPLINSVSYLNLSNVLNMNIEKNQVSIYTVFRPKYAAYRIHFPTHEEAVQFAESCLSHRPTTSVLAVQTRFHQPTPDPLAIQAIVDWEEEKQLK